MERLIIKYFLLDKTSHHILALLLLLSLGINSSYAVEYDKRAVAMYNLGLQQYKTGSIETAIIFFKRAIELDHKLTDAHFNLGTLYMSQKRFNEAIQQFADVLKYMPDDQEARFKLALCWESIGEKQRAIENYSAITSNHQHYDETQKRLANLQSNQNHYVVSPSQPTSKQPCGEVGLDGEIVLAPIAQANSNRVVQIQRYLNNALVASKDKTPSAVAITYTAGNPVLTLGGYQVITVDSDSAKAAGLSQAELAQMWANNLRAVLRNETSIKKYIALLTGESQPIRPVTSATDSDYKKEPTKPIQTETSAMVKPPEQLQQPSIPAPTANAPIRDKWAVIVGISKFSHPEYNLRFAAKDAEDFRDYLIKDANFRPDHVLTLINEQATRANIMRAFGSKWLPNLVEPGDVVVVYISTHGTPASSDSGRRNYIVAYDTDVNDLYVTAVDMDELARRIKEIKSDRAVIVLDTCYSGAGIPGSRGLQRYDNFNVKNIEMGSGHLVICASSPEERSWESNNSSNGVFTRYFIDSLKQNPNTNVKDAFDACSKKVQWEVKLTRGFTQTPQLGGLWQGSPPVLAAPAKEPRPMFLEKFADFGITPSAEIKKSDYLKKENQDNN